MRKLLLFLPALLLTALLLTSCKDSATGPVVPPTPEKGLVYVVSVPAGALVSIDGATTSKATPFTSDSLSAGNHTFKFVFSDYTTTLTQTVVSKKKGNYLG